VRILLSLVVVLSGLLMAREFMAHSNEQLRLALRGAKVVSEQSIGTVREPPALVAPMAAARIAEVSAQSITSAHEPPALLVPIAVARIAEVAEQDVATVHKPSECEQIWDQMTHMTREEWAEVCRRVDAEKQADISETASILPGG
jgi:hypothetical protein